MTLLKFTFPKSRAHLFPTLIDSCRKFDGFIEDETYELEIYEHEELLEQWETFKFIATMLPRVRDAKAFANGSPVVPFTTKLFTEIEDALHFCYDMGYDEELMPDHCVSEWGCRLLKDSVSFVHDEFDDMLKNWGDFGKIEDGAWKLDKEKIFKALEKEAKEKKLELCPAFSISRVKHLIKLLPVYVDISKTKWRLIGTPPEMSTYANLNPPKFVEPKPIDMTGKSMKEIDDFLDGLNAN